MAWLDRFGIDTVQELAQLLLTVALGAVVCYLAIMGVIDPDLLAGSFATVLGFWFRGNVSSGSNGGSPS
jgi:hypothetical protein